MTERAANVAFSYRQIKLLKAFVKLLPETFFKKSYEFFLYLKSFYNKRSLNLVLSLLMNKSTK